MPERRKVVAIAPGLVLSQNAVTRMKNRWAREAADHLERIRKPNPEVLRRIVANARDEMLAQGLTDHIERRKELERLVAHFTANPWILS